MPTTPRKRAPRAIGAPARRQPENAVLTACLRWLWDHGYFVWRNNVGAAKVGRRWLRFGLKGSSDILGVGPAGRLLAVECKTAKGVLSPEQAEFLMRVKRGGGIAIVARSVSDLEQVLPDKTQL